MKPIISISPIRSKITKDNNENFQIMIAVSPEKNTSKNNKNIPGRPALNLGLVIDNSPSMMGFALEEAKKATLDLLELLDDNDLVSIVTYSSIVNILLSPTKVGLIRNSTIIKTIKDLKVSGTATALQAGWLNSAKQLASFVDKNKISKIFLLSDGQANIGEINPINFMLESEKLFQAGISTSTYGIGLSFNEDIMTSIAKGGSGLAFFAENSISLIDYFKTELNLIKNTLYRNLKITVKGSHDDGEIQLFKKGVCYKRLSNNLEMSEQDCKSIKLNDLIKNSESWIIVEIKKESLPEKNITITVDLDYTDLSGNQKNIIKSLTIKHGLNFSINKKVQERNKELDAAILQESAVEYVKAGDILRATQAINEMSQSAVNNFYVKGVSENLTNLLNNEDYTGFIKEAKYGSYAMANRSVGLNESPTSDTSLDELGIKKIIQGKS